MLRVCANVSLYLLLFTCHSISTSDETEPSSPAADHEKEKYFRAANDGWRSYLEQIENASATYTECPRDECGCYRANIVSDLLPFRESGVTETMVEAARKHGVLYQVIGGVLYREAECLFEMRCRGVEHFLLDVAGDLGGDVEFVVNTRDWPMVPRGSPIPVFSFSKTREYGDILYPAWSFRQGGPAIGLYPAGLGRWDEHRRTLSAAARAWPWLRRSPRAFFRGSRTSPERDALVLLSRERPELVDARYTRNQAWRSRADTLGAEPAPEAPLEEHCRYRVLVNFRGVAASFRLRHLFLCGSVVLHVGEEWFEFFYSRLVPWFHFIPVPSYPSQQQLVEILQFVRENDEVVQKIADRGCDFIERNLRMEDVMCYWRELLKSYRRLLKYKPRRRVGLVLVSG